ncbi:2Fe-2S iron-sulfur cluster binding domain-containing protein [Nadsonia fulvescens var. elongata DSM 6958]|uniref:2Fe-2S iron-sulfur cluster binding domain-containing protein n=1 Tax=Nadsonia fulvescens var. elongata DSM 6958 TaxID=857566 RepID=A0A1E3PIH3_9ASCO|nr:2Fe-2S iron-sulfur cluster binding domain-containing protein [Nadsonia fulvescens var. elongata DSM 6958]
MSARILSCSISLASRPVFSSVIKSKLVSFSSSALIKARSFVSSTPALHGHVHKPKPGEEINVTFITKDGEQIPVQVAEGDNLLDIAQANNLDMEGACGGSCACSTCHVIVDPDFYEKLEEPDDDENDMLDLAFGLTETSRLGCQIIMKKEYDGIRIALPAMTRNLQVSDFDRR